MKKYILLIVLTSILLKVIFLFASGVYLTPYWFEDESIARNLLKNGEFYYDRFNTRYYNGMMPGFPFLCFLIYTVFGHNMLWIIFMQILITSLLVVPVYAIARDIFDNRTAILAAALCAVQPQFIIYSTGRLHPMNVYSFLFALMIFAFLRLRKNSGFGNILTAGLISGIAVLFRMTSLPVFFCCILWFYATAPFKAMQKIKTVTLTILTVFILILPWFVRNYCVFGKPLLLQTVKGENLWFGNMPGSSGSLYTETGESLVDIVEKNAPKEFFKMDEIAQSRYFENLAMKHIKENPLSATKGILKKIYFFWYFSPHQGNLYPQKWLDIYKVYYFAIIFLAIFSMIYNFRSTGSADKAGILLIILLFLVITGVHALYFVEARHRWAIESLVLIFTANGFIVFADYCRRLILKKN